jgi:hypothetical protein
MENVVRGTPSGPLLERFDPWPCSRDDLSAEHRPHGLRQLGRGDGDRAEEFAPERASCQHRKLQQAKSGQGIDQQKRITDVRQPPGQGPGTEREVRDNHPGRVRAEREV